MNSINYTIKKYDWKIEKKIVNWGVAYDPLANSGLRANSGLHSSVRETQQLYTVSVKQFFLKSQCLTTVFIFRFSFQNYVVWCFVGEGQPIAVFATSHGLGIHTFWILAATSSKNCGQFEALTSSNYPFPCMDIKILLSWLSYRHETTSFLP